MPRRRTYLISCRCDTCGYEIEMMAISDQPQRLLEPSECPLCHCHSLRGLDYHLAYPWRH